MSVMLDGDRAPTGAPSARNFGRECLTPWAYAAPTAWLRLHVARIGNAKPLYAARGCRWPEEFRVELTALTV